MSNELSIFEAMGGTYRTVDGILYPNISECSMLFLSKEIGSYLPVILLMMKPLMNFYQLEQKILVS